MALRIASGRIDVAHVVPGKRPALLRCESFGLAGSAAESLRRLRKALALERFHCTTLLDSAAYQLHQIDAPAVPQAELRQAVRWSIKDLIDYPAESAELDVVEIPGAGGAGRARSLFAVSARNSAIAACVAPYNDASVELEAIDVVEMAQRNIAILCEAPNRAVALLAFHPDGGMLTITGNAELLVARRIEIPLERLLAADAEQRSQYLDRIALELQRSLDNFDRQFSFISLSRLLLAYTPVGSGLAETLRANLDLPVEELDLAQVMDLARVPELASRERQAQCLTVIGAALRTEHRALTAQAAA